MSDWKEPKNDYTAGNQVTPEIFNTLATNEKHLKEITCQLITRKKDASEQTVNTLVLMEV